MQLLKNEVRNGLLVTAAEAVADAWTEAIVATTNIVLYTSYEAANICFKIAKLRAKVEVLVPRETGERLDGSIRQCWCDKGTRSDKEEKGWAVNTSVHHCTDLGREQN